MMKIENIGEAVTFRYLPTDKFTAEYFSVHFILPLSPETVSGYSLLTKLFKKGCRKYPTQGALARKLEELYATSLSVSVGKQGEKQVISLGMDMLSSRFVFDGASISNEACALLFDVICDPPLDKSGFFSETAVAREKAALLNQLRAQINNKKTYVLKRCREIMCENEPYSIPLEGTEESISACTPEGLYALYMRMLREAVIEIFYVGSEPFVWAKKQATDLVSRLGVRAPVAPPTLIIPRAECVKRKTEAVNAVQGKLAIGFRTGLTESSSIYEKDALLLFNIIYGTSSVSKLFMNVREKLSLCYYCASRNDNQKGVLFVHSGIENDKKTAAEDEILAQLEEIRLGHISEEEMIAAKLAFRDLTRSVYDSPYTIEQWYLMRTHQGDHRTPEEMEKAIDALNVTDVVAAAKRITLDTVFFLEGKSEEAEDDEASV